MAGKLESYFRDTFCFPERLRLRCRGRGTRVVFAEHVLMSVCAGACLYLTLCAGTGGSVPVWARVPVLESVCMCAYACWCLCLRVGLCPSVPAKASLVCANASAAGWGRGCGGAASLGV